MIKTCQIIDLFIYISWVTAPLSISFKRSARLPAVYQSVFGSCTIQINKRCNNKFIQHDYGKVVLSDSEEGESESSQESEQSSQHSQSSAETDSSQEEMEQIDPWDRIQDEALKRHESRFHDLVNEYEQNGDSSEVARIKAVNALLPVYRNQLRKVFLEYLQWMHGMKKDSTFQKVMQTQKELKDTEGFDWQKSVELAIDKRKFLLKLIVCQTKSFKGRKLNQSPS